MGEQKMSNGHRRVEGDDVFVQAGANCNLVSNALDFFFNKQEGFLIRLISG